MFAVFCANWRDNKISCVMIHYRLIFLFLIYIYISSFNGALTFFFLWIFIMKFNCVENSVKVPNNLSNWTSGRSIQLSDNYGIGRWSITKRNEGKKKSFFMRKNSKRNRVLLMNVFNFNTSRIQCIRNFFASKTSAYQLKLYPVFLFFFFFTLDKENNLFHNAIFQQVTRFNQLLNNWANLSMRCTKDI